MKDFMEKHGVSKLYKYHEIPRDNKIVEFGWIEASEVAIDGPIVLSKVPSFPDANSAVSLPDYQEYFSKLTSLTPSEFLEKWKPSPKEFEIFWYSDKSHSEPGLHEFIMKLAYLIRDRTPFEHQFERYLATFEIVEESDEKRGDEN